jgi:hypothetical protein
MQEVLREQVEVEQIPVVVQKRYAVLHVAECVPAAT